MSKFLDLTDGKILTDEVILTPEEMDALELTEEEKADLEALYIEMMPRPCSKTLADCLSCHAGCEKGRDSNE